MSRFIYLLSLCGFLLFSSCKKNSTPPVKAEDTTLSFTVNGIYNGTLSYKNLPIATEVKFSFTEAIDETNLKDAILMSDDKSQNVELQFEVLQDKKSLSIRSKSPLQSLSRYTLLINNKLRTSSGGKLINPLTISLVTTFDNQDKFPRISDEELLTLVQRQTFKYFWDEGHPESGMARERNSSGHTVTTGGTGFGVMSMIVGIHRNFITREAGLARIRKIVNFLKNNATTYHGAFAHWINGQTGATIPFSAKDNGADLVETSLLFQGLLTAKQYFNSNNTEETSLRADIQQLYENIDWNWFRKDGGQVLYWHWSPTNQWEMNLPVQGWNECLITYVLAASSPTHGIPASVYHEGWARNGGMKNGQSYYQIQLPLGSQYGGPLFLSHYSFLGINPRGLKDQYADYEVQTRAHALINYNYCVTNPNKHQGYSENCWGLTASDIPAGYTASSPTNDRGVIAPTAALSSFPYTPTESLKALHFFYYKLGNKIWTETGFMDSFSLNDPWFSTSALAIDQGPIIVMIENYRSQLLWDLFMNAPEIKTGMKKLGFSSPHL